METYQDLFKNNISSLVTSWKGISPYQHTQSVFDKTHYPQGYLSPHFRIFRDNWNINIFLTRKFPKICVGAKSNLIETEIH